MSIIRRFSGNQDAALKTDATSPEIDIGHYASGQIHIPTGSTITTLTYHTAPTKGGTYLPAQDASGAAVTQTVGAAKSYPIPAILFGAAMLKIVVNAAGTVSISLKT